jgi:hypothetical protein
MIPTIDKSHFLDYRAIIGDPFTFQTIISGNPEPDFIWKKNGKSIDESLDKLKVTKDGNQIILFINSIDESHSGKYSLIIMSPNGKDEASFKLTVVSAQNKSTTPSVKLNFTSILFVFYFIYFILNRIYLCFSDKSNSINTSNANY